MEANDAYRANHNFAVSIGLTPLEYKALRDHVEAELIGATTAHVGTTTILLATKNRIEDVAKSAVRRYIMATSQKNGG